MGERIDQMTDGEWYRDAAELVELRRQCWRQLERFNALPVDAEAERDSILRDLLGSVGAQAVVLPRLQCSYGRHVRLGDRVFVNHDVLFMDDAEIRVGDDVRIGPRTQLLTATHPIDDHARRRIGWERALPISIGSNSWLGAGVIVCPGVEIGSDVVIGAGSVVTRSVGDRVLAVGNPARVVRDL